VKPSDSVDSNTAGLKKGLKQKINMANLQTEADLKLYGDSAISGKN